MVAKKKPAKKKATKAKKKAKAPAEPMYYRGPVPADANEMVRERYHDALTRKGWALQSDGRYSKTQASYDAEYADRVAHANPSSPE